MSSTYEFKFKVYPEEDVEDSLFPESSTVTALHEFPMGHTWEPILWQFCRFLESTGFERVREQVIIKDEFNRCGFLFQDYFDREVEINEDGLLKFADEVYHSHGDK